MRFTVTYLGTSAAIPTTERGLAATAIQRGSRTLLIDCGEGTQRQLRRSAVGLVEVDGICFTHFHGDHYLGVIGLLKSYDLLGRRKPLQVWGPAGVTEVFTMIAPVIGPLGFELLIEEAHPGRPVRLAGDDLQITPFATQHAVPSLGYRLAEPSRPGVFDVAAAQALGLAPGPGYAALQQGRSISVNGRTIRPVDVVGPARPGRSVALTGDTEPCQATVEAAAGVDLLVHESTFVASERDRARATRHSCADEAARVASAAGARLLALTHLSQRSSATQVSAEARPFVDNVVVPNDFDSYELPLHG